MGYQVNHLARLLAQLLSRHVAHYGVAPGQFPVLLALYDEDGQTPAELCAAVAVEPGTMTKTLQRMERDTLIERRPDPHDGRRIRIHLTARARQLEPKLKAIAVDLNATVLEGISLHQRGCFMGALRRVIRNTEAQLQANDRRNRPGNHPGAFASQRKYDHVSTGKRFVSPRSRG